MNEEEIAFYLKMARRIRWEGNGELAFRMERVARILSWVPKPEQPNPMYRPVRRA